MQRWKGLAPSLSAAPASRTVTRAGEEREEAEVCTGLFPPTCCFASSDSSVSPCRYLSHTELAPLRAPLIPMEHCTTRFFEACDVDNDKYIALEEWAGCFGIKERKYPE